MAITCRSFLLFLLITFSVSSVSAEIRFTEIGSDDRPIITFDEFGFTHTGRLELNVSQVTLSIKNPRLNLAKVGFFLCTRDAWERVFQQLVDGEITCALESDHVKFVTDFKFLKGKSSFDTVFRVNEPDRYTLVLANCLWRVKVSMNVRSAMYNLEGKQNRRDYLSAGETILPTVFFLSSLVSFALAGIWIFVLYKRRLTVSPVHSFMLAFVILKAFILVLEAANKQYIKRTGSAPDYDISFYISSFLKGMMLYTLIVLIGYGWSHLKPYLQDKEKNVLKMVIPLQVVAHFALVFIEETSLPIPSKPTWKIVASVLQLICYCTVSLRMFRSSRNLREAAPTDEKAAAKLMKLTAFILYYVTVICYIYFTRLLVYVLGTTTSYKNAWTSVVVGELATVAFCVFSGYKFRPAARNPYSVIDDEEKYVAAEQVKVEDEKRIGQ
ncbi:hypothetical protein V6N13_086287 [Hibiscus sabdariffa]|uniref:Uncharacterized protein n=1 Tax=Hibiscus sabdariffa TaxID=183260 RepID=A0ABR2FTH8_9ROSI